jgi:hypothetical protein
MGKAKREHASNVGREPYPTIPPGKKQAKPLVKLTTPGKWLILSDIHVPFHDAKAVEIAVNYGIDAGCDHLLLNGDVLDAYQASHWIRDPNERSVDKECEIASRLIKSIESHFSGRKVYKIGNHEERIENYLWCNAPQMIGISKWDLCEELRKQLALGDDWQFIASKQLYKLGKLNGYHGHELPRGLTNPVSVGRGVWLRTKQTGFTSHWHSTSTHIESDGAKKHTWVCFSLGCLCDLHPCYAPVNGWNAGFCVVEIDKSGNFTEQNKRIVDGAVW